MTTEFVNQWPEHVEPFLKAGGFDLYKKRYTGSEARFRSQLESGTPPHLVVLDADARFIPIPLADLTACASGWKTSGGS